MTESETPQTSKPSGISMTSKIRLSLIAIGLILVLIIVLQNTEAVETKLLFMTITAPRAVLLFGTTVAGYVLGIFTAARFGK